MNSKDYRNIREAYLQVYAPQELTEEQVWEEVEYWVNSLLEEGYDLSDYTWEEMYESYLSEYNVEAEKRTIQRRDQALGFIGNQSRRLANATIDSFKTDSNPTKGQDTIKSPKPNISAERPVSKFVGARDAAIEKAKNIKGSPVVGSGSGNVTRPTATPTTQRPSTPTTTAPRPTATSAASGPKSTPTTSTTPTAPKPAIGTTPGGTKFERRTPTSAELSAAQDARAAGKGEEGAIKAGVEASKPATPAPNPVKANVPGFALGSKPPTPTDSGESDKLKIKKSDVTSGFDMFDVVKGYLIGEGYADTEEAALAIMANMSEDWRDDIISEGPNYDKNRQRAAKRAAERNAARDAGKTGNVPGVGYVTPRRERETYRDAAGVERHTSGARMPKKDEGDK